MTSRTLSEASGQGPPSRKRPREQTPTSPSKRSKACERCWKRKQRCDRKLPNCTNCQTSGFECLARPMPLRESFEDVTLTHATFQSYLEALERNTVSQDSHVPSPLDEDSSAAAPRVQTNPSNDGAGSGPSGEEDPSIRDTMGAIGHLTNSAMAESRSEADQSVNKMTLVHMVEAALAIDGHDPSISTSRKSGPFGIDKAKLCALPSRDEAVGYIRSYLSAVFHIPCLVRSDEDTLMSHFDQISALTPEQQISQAHSSDSTEISANTSATGLFDMYMKLAIGIMVSQDAIRLAHYAQSLHGAATRLLPAVLSSQNHADSLRSLLLLIAFSLYHPDGGSAWHLLGLAIRLCITSGFNKEPTGQNALSNPELEEVKWLFWSVYVLDRWISVAMDRPFGIQDEDISIELPSDRSEDLASRTSQHEATKTSDILGLHFIRYAQIVSDIRTNTRANPMSHYGNLTNWRDFDPPPESSSDMARLWEDSLGQLECRGLLQVIHLLGKRKPEAQHSNHERADTMSAAMIDEVRGDAKAACLQFITTSYDRFGERQATRSFLDAYDIVAATVGYICLESRQGQALMAGPGVNDPDKATLMEVVHKASVLVTQIASRFPALDGFHRVFLSLFSKSLSESLGPMEDFPPRLPISLRRLIEATFSPATSY